MIFASTRSTFSLRVLTLGLSALLVVLLAACGNKAEQGQSPQQSQASSHSAHAQHNSAQAETASAQTGQSAAVTGEESTHSAHHGALTDEASAHADHALHTQDAAAHEDHSAHEQLSAGPLPGTSIYHLATSFTDHHQRALALPDLRGTPAVFVMFYGDCNTACPILVRSAEQIEEALPDDLRQSTQFVMVSFDTERDTPDNLRTYAELKGLDKDNWHWLVGTPLQTRQLATLLGVQYRDAGNGMFAHSNLVTVVDPEGVPTARLEGLGVKLDPAVEAIRQAGL